MERIHSTVYSVHTVVLYLEAAGCIVVERSGLWYSDARYSGPDCYNDGQRSPYSVIQVKFQPRALFPSSPQPSTNQQSEHKTWANQEQVHNVLYNSMQKV
jgi:hypothetical protein